MAFVIFEDCLVGEGERVPIKLKIRRSGACLHQRDHDERAKPTEARTGTPIAETHIKGTPKRLYFCLR